MDEKPGLRRFSFRFGTRDLLWGMVVVGLSLAWWNESRSNWPTAHPRWREFCEGGDMVREPLFITVEYANGESQLSGWSGTSPPIVCGLGDIQCVAPNVDGGPGESGP